MGIENERRFLLKNNVSMSYVAKLSHSKAVILQGYLPINDPCVRVRSRSFDGGVTEALITVKSVISDAKNNEFEYSIPVADADEMIRLYCGKRVINKIRYYMLFGDTLWELDFFSGEYDGLVIAEVEMRSADEELEIPGCMGVEITGINMFRNYNLALQIESGYKWKYLPKRSDP